MPCAAAGRTPAPRRRRGPRPIGDARSRIRRAAIARIAAPSGSLCVYKLYVIQGPFSVNVRPRAPRTTTPPHGLRIVPVVTRSTLAPWRSRGAMVGRWMTVDDAEVPPQRREVDHRMSRGRSRQRPEGARPRASHSEIQQASRLRQSATSSQYLEQPSRPAAGSMFAVASLARRLKAPSRTRRPATC